MTIEQQLVTLLKTALPTVGIYVGTIPENADVPALAVYNVAFNNSRDIEGNKTKKWSAWRLTVVDTVEHLQTVLDAIELIDNTVNSDFQKLFVNLTLKEPKAQTEPHQRAFFDMQVYPK